jgi:hypothetical protein
VIYGSLIGVPVFLLCLADILRVCRRIFRARSVAGKAESEDRPAVVAVICGLTVALILSIQQIGYPLALFLYLTALGRLLYRGPWITTVLTSLGLVALVHFIFVQQLELGLPAGDLWDAIAGR